MKIETDALLCVVYSPSLEPLQPANRDFNDDQPWLCELQHAPHPCCVHFSVEAPAVALVFLDLSYRMATLGHSVSYRVQDWSTAWYQFSMRVEPALLDRRVLECHEGSHLHHWLSQGTPSLSPSILVSGQCLMKYVASAQDVI
jgi:hypothetical protein